MSETPKCDAAIAAAEAEFEASIVRMRAYEEASQDDDPPDKCPEWARAQIARAQEMMSLCRKERERWHGKFAIVTQENNALRKANRALRVALANLQINAECAKFETAGSGGLFIAPCNCPRCTGRPPEPPLFEEDECSA